MKLCKLGVELLNQKMVALGKFHHHECALMENPYMVYVFIFVEDANFEHGPDGSH